MSNNLNDLNIHTPFIFDEYMKESPFVKVDMYKSLRLTSSSDVDCTLEIIFSVDPSCENGPRNSMRISSVWSTRRIDVILPYLKIKLYKLNITDENNHLCVNFLCPNIMDSKENEADDESSEIESKSRNLFSNLMKRRSKNEKVEPKADVKYKVQIPDLIPRNSLLVGTYSNGVSTVPPPMEPNMILMYNGHRLEWVNILSIIGEKSVNLCNLN